MNKMNTLLLAGLMIVGMNNTYAMSAKEREILYTLNTLGQDFIDVPMITQNIDMFIGVIEMNINLNEARLMRADQKLENTLWNSGALFLGGLLGKLAFLHIVEKTFTNKYTAFNLRNILVQGTYAAGAMVGITWPALNIHNAWKVRSALIEALERDRDILVQLESIKDSMDQNPDQAGKILLESAE